MKYRPDHMLLYTYLKFIYCAMEARVIILLFKILSNTVASKLFLSNNKKLNFNIILENKSTLRIFTYKIL